LLPEGERTLLGNNGARLSGGDRQRLAIARELQHHIKTIIGISTQITVMDADSIPRTQTGKARRVVDNRPKQV
jgi:ABC-type transport system involved in Fe-S cluster assembly fused permease/ATPase subunit